MRRKPAFLLLGLWLLPAALQAVVEPPKMNLIERENHIEDVNRERIQKEILDRVFGPEKASVFVDVELQLKSSRKDNLRAGAGAAEKYKAKGDGIAGVKTQFILPGVPKPKNINKDDEGKRPEASQGQMAQQVKTMEEELYTQVEEIKNFQVIVIHDRTIPPPKIGEAHALIFKALSKYQVKMEDIKFREASYHVPEKDWKKDLMEPKVYLPLLYAFLLLLLLWFLFVPFARFLRRYTEALAAKPAAEINAETNITPPEDEDGKGKGGGPEESALEVLLGQKPPEVPPPPPDDDDEELEEPAVEEEEMEKFEPFEFINEENVGRLKNFFLVRREQPWLIATVLSYLKPEYARQLLTGLPVSLQSKVAMEALKVRQVTREQILAIETQVKENIDFVVGGVERLIRMLEEADPQTRANILDSLQNEKPAVFDFVRKALLLFDDIAKFPDREMQTIVRELKTEVMAGALRGAAPDVVNKFFNNMSAGAASLLKESMEYQKDLTQVQIDEARSQIVEHIKVLDKEGRIALQKDDEGGGFDEVIAEDQGPSPSLGAAAPPAGESSAPAAPPVKDPAEGRRLYETGVQQHQAGNIDQAVSSFRQAIERDPELWDAYQFLGQGLYQTGRTGEAVMYYEKYLEHNPDPELRAWVDSFKTQQGA